MPSPFVTKIQTFFRSGGMARDTLWSALHDLLQLVSVTVMVPILTRNLGVGSSGKYIGLYGIVGPVGGLTWAGISLAVVQRSFRDELDTSTLMKHFWAMTLGVGTTVAIVGTVVGSQIIAGVSVVAVGSIMYAELVAAGATMVLASIVQRERGFATAARVKMGIFVCRLIVVTGLFAFNKISIANIAIGFAFVFTMYMGFFVFYLFPRWNIAVKFGKPNERSVRSTASLSIPISAQMMQQDGDKAILNAYNFDNDAGLYGAAFRLVALGMMPIRALNAAAFQRFVPHEESAINQHVKRALMFAAVATPASIVIAIVMYVGRDLLTVIAGSDFEEAADIVPWLLPFLPLAALSNAPSNGLVGLGKLKERAYVYFAGAGVSVGCYIALIPSMTWKGAVIGTIVGEIVLVVFGWLALVHYQRKHNSTVELNTSK